MTLIPQAGWHSMRPLLSVHALKSQPSLFTSANSSGFQRPVMILLDRSADVGVMMQHAWSYCCLCHDVLELRLNKLTLHEPQEAGGRPRTIDLNSSDAFWTSHMGAAFQSVAADVDQVRPRDACMHAHACVQVT